ncbi:MAG: exodeoxyribonuclease VII small subunit [Magnetospiraceae bacterium]
MAKKPIETALPADIVGLSFEAALEELEQLVRKLEGGQATLDQAIDSYTRGSQLKAHCEQKLAEAKARIEKISVSAEGEISATPSDLG